MTFSYQYQYQALIPSSSPPTPGAAGDPSSKNRVGRRHPTHRARSPTELVRHQSSNSCYSQQSLPSNATGSSTRTHRRSSVEIGTFLFGPRRSEGSAERRDAARRRAKARARHDRGARPRVGRRGVSAGSRSAGSARSSEGRGPSESGHAASSSASSCGRVRAPSSDSTPESSRRGAVEVEVDPAALRARELIRELSFETISVPRTEGSLTGLVSGPKNAPLCDKLASLSADRREVSDDESYDDDDDDDDDAALFYPAGFETEASEPPPPPAASFVSSPPPVDRLSPPLPPKIHRVASCPVPDVPCQVSHNRNRARSTSLSEMSESCLNEFANADDSRSHGTRSSDGEEFSAVEKKSLVTAGSGGPPRALSLSPRPPLSLWNRGRSASAASDQSSYVPSDSSDDLSARGRGGVGRKREIGRARPPEGKPWHRGRASTVASDMSSYVSSASSSSSDVSVEGAVETGEGGHRAYIDVPDRYPDQEIGHLSLQEGKCNTYQGDGGAGPIDPRVPRLTADALREWNAICQEEYAPRLGIIKNRFVFRALSCPNKMSDAASPERGRDCEEGAEEGSVEEPHLMDVISQSLFSYTNSGYSRADSTLSSQDNDETEEAMSDLDFDMAFIYSVDKGSAGTPAGGADRPSRRHRRRHSYSIEKSSIGAPLDSLDRFGRGHRRSRSSGSRPGKPSVTAQPAPPNEDGLLKRSSSPTGTGASSLMAPFSARGGPRSPASTPASRTSRRSRAHASPVITAARTSTSRSLRSSATLPCRAFPRASRKPRRVPSASINPPAWRFF